mmetsp:Transcript_14895/g.14998  ORF Transcript_14895/g.14998 Transcript_14895/m.14998 type:complete len:153 (-) Transcript_14895:246-704(-)
MGMNDTSESSFSLSKSSPSNIFKASIISGDTLKNSKNFIQLSLPHQYALDIFWNEAFSNTVDEAILLDSKHQLVYSISPKDLINEYSFSLMRRLLMINARNNLLSVICDLRLYRIPTVPLILFSSIFQTHNLHQQIDTEYHCKYCIISFPSS